MDTQINGRELVAQFWQEKMRAHPTFYARLNITKGIFEFFFGGHVIPWALYKLLMFSSRVADGVLMAAALWITAINVAPAFMTGLAGGSTNASNLSALSLLAFSLLPELITVAALVITIKHIITFCKRRTWSNPAWAWATLYAIPTLTFLNMTIWTISSFVSHDGAAHITGGLLVTRCLAAWGYSFVEILYFELGRQSMVEADEKAKLRAENADLRNASAEVSQQRDALTQQVDALTQKIQEQADALARSVHVTQADVHDALPDAPKPTKNDAPKKASRDASKPTTQNKKDASGKIVDMSQGSALHEKIHQMLDKDASLSGYELAKLAGCSEPTARRVKTRYLKMRQDASPDAQNDASAM